MSRFSVLKIHKLTFVLLISESLCWRACWKSATRASLDRNFSSCSQEDI